MPDRESTNIKAVLPRETYMIAGLTSDQEKLVALSYHEDCRVRLRVAENPATPLSVLCRLALDVDREVRLAVSDHPRASLSLLEVLAGDEDAEVRYGLAENANTPKAILLTLANDDNPFVARRAETTIERISTKHNNTGKFVHLESVPLLRDDVIMVAAC